MRAFFFLLILPLFNSCTAKEKQVKQQIVKQEVLATSPVNYDSCKKAILINKKKYRLTWKNLSRLEKEKNFIKAVTETIAPAWIGTTWDFNGTTETPQQGSIACGYFVTTVLRDAGLPISRVKLAQCASEQMITSLIQAKYINRFSNLPLEDFINQYSNKAMVYILLGLITTPVLFTTTARISILYIQHF